MRKPEKPARPHGGVAQPHASVLGMRGSSTMNSPFVIIDSRPVPSTFSPRSVLPIWSCNESLSRTTASVLVVLCSGVTNHSGEQQPGGEQQYFLPYSVSTSVKMFSSPPSVMNRTKAVISPNAMNQTQALVFRGSRNQKNVFPLPPVSRALLNGTTSAMTSVRPFHSAKCESSSREDKIQKVERHRSTWPRPTSLAHALQMLVGDAAFDSSDTTTSSMLKPVFSWISLYASITWPCHSQPVQLSPVEQQVGSSGLQL